MNEKNSWNSKLENNVIEIFDKVNIYKTMYFKESKNYNSIYNYLMYCGIFLGPLSGLISGIGTSFDPDADPTFPIISSCIAFISGIIIAIIKFGNFEQKSLIYKKYASKFQKLESSINNELILEKSERENIFIFLKNITEKFNILFSEAPLMRNKIYNKYTRGLSPDTLPSSYFKNNKKNPDQKISKIPGEEKEIKKKILPIQERIKYEMDRMNKI